MRDDADRPSQDVVVVEPFAVVRAGLIGTIDASPGLKVVASAASAEEAMVVVERRAGLVILVSMGLAGEQDAFWLIRSIRERFPGHVILAMGANADPNAVSRALFTGADGFVDKNVEVEQFLSAIRGAGEEEVVIAGPAADSVGTIAEGIERRRSLAFRLTRREREVLVVAAEGLTAREIADRLGVRERTVTTHLARIYGKLGVGNRLAALRLAARSGLVSLRQDE
ncbi:MAG: response regulator containing a CheY-like receiver domain and an DNA-binding domain protein [Actinomycetia bacterium]|nr:response regulator containing a CheY-like receiver domain and an DNA-binding domain protein [Actinomycetes bacterium]